MTAREKTEIKRSLLSCVRGAGKILLDHLGQMIHPRRKVSDRSVVCDADFAAEKFILSHINQRFPDHNTVSEESGRDWKGSEFTWVIDPLDGTSNFVANLPWFGVQIGVLQGGTVILAAMYLPITRTLYFAGAGEGAFRNGERIQVTSESAMENTLCAFGFDPTSPARGRKGADLLFRISRFVRNVRATNSLVDFCYTVDGRFGACINLKTKIWDIVPVSLVLPEAGGRFTDLNGSDIPFEFDDGVMEREYAVLGASKPFHARLVKSTKSR